MTHQDKDKSRALLFFSSLVGFAFHPFEILRIQMGSRRCNALLNLRFKRPENSNDLLKFANPQAYVPYGTPYYSHANGFGMFLQHFIGKRAGKEKNHTR